MPDLNWWTNRPNERFWLEATDREDLGADLTAPETDESGRDNWRYSLFKRAHVGDIVFHYQKKGDSPGIVAFSRIAGKAQPAKIVWAARGTYARSKGVLPHERDAYKIPLSDFTELARPLSLDRIRSRRKDLAALHEALMRDATGPLYFPFELSANREPRLLQGYAFKLPLSFVKLFSELSDAAIEPSSLPLGDPVSSESSDSAHRNPRWSRDELILALDLYLRFRQSPPGKESEEVMELSAMLNQMGHALGQADIGTYRNPNGVYMKLMNLRRFDPEYTSAGRVGLTRGNKDEATVWTEFADDPEKLAAVVGAIRSAVEKHAHDGVLSGLDEPDFTEAEEGRVLTRLHRTRERNRKLVEARKKLAFKRHGRLFCEVCHFDFGREYGEAVARIIDCHHVRPVHTLAEGEKTRIDDLALLCANCHRVIHSFRPWLSVDKLRAMRSAAKP